MELGITEGTIYWKLYNYQYNLVNKNFCLTIFDFDLKNIAFFIQNTVFEDSDDPKNKIEIIMEITKEEFDFLIEK